MKIDVVSIFPEYLAPLDLSLPGKARAKGVFDLHVHDLRAWTHDRHHTVDDTPAGGGAGMVMKPEPWGEALDEVAPDGAVLVVPTPAGRRFTQADAADLAQREHLVFACGRYEGIDQRVLDDAARRMEVREYSLGDYVLNGGEVAALAMIEAITRLLPGFVGNPESLVEESHQQGLLEAPVFTKPSSWRDLDVPEVLLSGDHARIAAWRARQSAGRTALRRPDLLPGSAVGEWELAPAVRADAPELLTLQLACWVPEALANDDLRIPPLHEGLTDVVESIEHRTTTVVRVAGRLVGSVRAHLVDDDVWDIGRLMVAPDLRGRGLGRVLLEHAELQAPPQAATFRLFTGKGSQANLRRYKRSGYRVRQVLDGPVGPVVLTKPRISAPR